MADPLTAISTRRTPQSERADARQVPNSAGGYAFQASDDVRVRRFLTIGTTGGTYYISEQKLTKDNADLILTTARERGEWLVGEILAVSLAGRAPKQNPAIFALAAVFGVGDSAARKAATENFSAIIRTGTHLFMFATYVEQFRGWGRGLRGAVGGWYSMQDVDKVAYQIVKYRQREGWTHRDLLRLSHPLPQGRSEKSLQRRALFNYVTHPERAFEGDSPTLPSIVEAYELAQDATTPRAWVALIERYPSLSWEMLPDAAVVVPDVWRALINNGMPQTALMRQLPRLTRLGVLDDQDTRARVVRDLTDPERLKRGRVHPMSVLVAQRTYQSGAGVSGSGTWEPNRHIVDALDASFYAAFGAVEPAGKRTLLALDVSASMGWSSPLTGVTCSEASAALSLITMATEPHTDVVGFMTGLQPLNISPRQRLDDATRAVRKSTFGGTDCALPMTWATENRREYDTFVVYTDNETWAGRTHPHQALRAYRDKSGINARLIVCGMVANDFTIADPTDPGMLDIAGMDSAVPRLITDFSAARV
jgi:60 kDa SS-A/Ro ribonucleoprotein